MVGLGKISSWFLLVIISVIIVAQLKHVKAGRSTLSRRIRTHRAPKPSDTFRHNNG
jgi:hypothetical protein